MALHVAANLSKNKIDYNKIRETDELEETLVAEEREDLSFVWEAVKACQKNTEKCFTSTIRKVIHQRDQ